MSLWPLRWVARHREKSPPKLSGRQIVGRDRAACAFEIRASIADHDGIAGNQWCARDEIMEVHGTAAGQRVDFPNATPGRSVDCMEIAVERGDVDSTLPNGD